jgi:DNA repair protein RadD
MAITLRPYQEKIIIELREALRQYSSVIVRAPTGTGKTALASKMLGNAVQKGKKAFFIVHRQELIEQSSKAFCKADVPHGFVCAGQPINPFVPMQICSIDTLKNRLDRLSPPDLIVFDEAHHCKATGWQRVKEYYPNAKVVGLTATPCRLDGKGLIDIFQHIIHSPSVKWFIEQGYLSPYKVFAPHIPNLKGVHSRMGDYAKNELENLMDNSTIVGNAIQHYHDLAHNKRAIAFCVSIKHSEHVAAQFNEAGYKAIHIDGSIPRGQRKEAIDKFRAGEIQILTNVDIVGEGFDLPDIEASILLRPTQSLALYLQQVGRALRPTNTKNHALILDHAGNTLRHGLLDEEREWSLEDTKTIRRSENNKKKFPIRTCTKCFHTHRPAPVCPSCGFVYESAGDIPTELLGNLVEIDPLTFIKQGQPNANRNKIIDSLIEMGKKRNMKDPIAWAVKLYTAGKVKKG